MDHSSSNLFKREWDKSPSLSIIFGLSSKTQWLSGLYYADFISFYSPTQLCGGGTTKSNSNELPISVPLSFLFSIGSEEMEYLACLLLLQLRLQALFLSQLWQAYFLLKLLLLFPPDFL